MVFVQGWKSFFPGRLASSHLQQLGVGGRAVLVLVGFTQPPAVPDLIAVPNRAVVEIAELGTMPEERLALGRRRRRGAAAAAVRVGEKRIARPRIAGDLESLLIELLDDLEVLREHRFLGLARRRPAQNHRHRRIERLRNADVRVAHQKIEDGLRLRLRERVGAGALLRVAAIGRLASSAASSRDSCGAGRGRQRRLRSRARRHRCRIPRCRGRSRPCPAPTFCISRPFGSRLSTMAVPLPAPTNLRICRTKPSPSRSSPASSSNRPSPSLSSGRTVERSVCAV